MYAIGDKLLYGTLGVMEIVDITEQSVGDVTKQYYVLKEYASSSTSLTYVPTDNELLLANIKPLLTKEEIIEVIKTAKESPLLDWIEDNRARAEYYKKVLASLDRTQMLVMIETVIATGKKREKEGKKNYIADENSMRRAEKLISTEFSLVLGIPEAEVPEFIKKCKRQKMAL